ncbi:MAG TPA: hypothetical protein VKB79_14135 [Bryobacteraceae bacterium]|nr:hypothetical protein [Bryobacteraceae bacterium]
MTKMFLLAGLTASLLMAGPPQAASSAFDSYIATVEARLACHTTPGHNDLFLERVAGQELPGALLHHWRGAAFAPEAKVADFEQILRGFESYPRVFSPQVLETRVLGGDRDHAQISMRVRQKHVITVTMDATYDVSFGRLDEQRGFSVSRSTRVAEIDSPGASAEHPLDDEHEHGFLWRLNTYWVYEERDGGLGLRVEAVSLTRSIPRGLGWAIRPWVESVPRESLEFTLRSALTALAKRAQ